MSRINGGGIFGRPSGKTSGIVFGAARTRTGKVSTTRELVAPSNPNTSAQQAQRTKFSQALFIVRAIGSSIYQSDWNRAIGQLPGFQSMQSIFLNALGAAGLLSAPADTNLGTLDVPSGLTVSDIGSQTIEVEWASAAGNGTSSDLVKAILIPAALANRSVPADIESQVTSTINGGGTYDFSSLVSGADYIVCVYRVGESTAAGLLSVAQWFSVSVA